jgi:hypothetical protein
MTTLSQGSQSEPTHACRRDMSSRLTLGLELRASAKRFAYVVASRDVTTAFGGMNDDVVE